MMGTAHLQRVGTLLLFYLIEQRFCTHSGVDLHPLVATAQSALAMVVSLVDVTRHAPHDIACMLYSIRVVLLR